MRIMCRRRGGEGEEDAKHAANGTWTIGSRCYSWKASRARKWIARIN